jgi:YidC/Oxa1 family membrane protein insertase
VLRSFNRTTGGFGQPHMSVIENRMTGNYVFTPADVGHFLDANLWGAPIGAFMTQRTGLDAFTHFSRPALIAVGTPVMILAGIATYFNSRASVARQSPEAAANPQTAMMNKLALYVFPLGVVVGGPFLPLAIILYWFSNNIWTFAQQHYVFGMIEKEDEAKRQEAIQRRAANAPAPGAKPKRNPKATPPSGNGSSTSGTDDTDAGSGSAATDSGGSDGERPGAKTGQARPEKPTTTGRDNGPTNRTPRPGARPKRRKR